MIIDTARVVHRYFVLRPSLASERQAVSSKPIALPNTLVCELYGLRKDEIAIEEGRCIEQEQQWPLIGWGD
jgi:hypothetical protein